MKVCNKCKLSKPLNNFELSYSKVNLSSRRNTCKSCRNSIRKIYESRHGLGLSIRRLKYLYNLSLEDYKKLLQKQNNKCYICKNKTKLVVDHCHKTGKVRKLLCHKCNRGIGQFNDDPTLCIVAAKYLKQHIKA